MKSGESRSWLAGSDLPARWRGNERFVVLETGFGGGQNFLATWDAWRHDPDRCWQLHYLSIDPRLPTRADLALAWADLGPSLRDLADDLIKAWPPLTPNLHSLGFAGGRVQLLLAPGDLAAWLPELVAVVDAFYLADATPAHPGYAWQPRIFKALARLAAPHATAALWNPAEAVLTGLRSAGFAVRPRAGARGQGDITTASFAPRFEPRRNAVRHGATAPAGSSPRRAVIVGAGLAGCAAAWALAQQGWTCTLIDRHAAPAQEASGNPAGLFHGIVNPQDGAHARFNRAAALQVQSVVRRAIEVHGVSGSANGLLRLEPAQGDGAAMQRQLQHLGLPADYVRALNPAEASALCDIALQHPAWLYPTGGWVAPGALARAMLADAGAAASYRGGIKIQALRRCTAGWELLDTRGAVVDMAGTVVLANAFDALRLLGGPAWPVEKVRGQISQWRAGTGWAVPLMPIAGVGYVLPLSRSEVIFGATSQRGDDDPSVRDSDHLRNLAQLGRLTGNPVGHIGAQELQGRTAWRMVSRDRLPIIGGVPDLTALAPPGRLRLDQPRFVPRLPGLFVFTALGSRGITWSALGAQVLASSITGAPQPLEARLLDAIDPARFVSRAVRRSVGAG